MCLFDILDLVTSLVLLLVVTTVLLHGILNLLPIVVPMPGRFLPLQF